MNQEEKKRKTRHDLADAAIRLFTEQGYENVTMADVAEASAVSRRTAFRYFPSKADLLLEYPHEWRNVFDSVIVENRSLPLKPRLRLAVIAVGEHISQNPEPVRLLFGLAFQHSTIAGRYAATSQAWIERIYTELIYEREPHQVNNEAHMVAAAYMGIIDASCGLWVKDEGELVELLDEGISLAEATLLTNFT